ncbi:ABC transporter permease [Paenibacillus soyae]|uniref:ABC transporter permease n=1 Tax=Paenibacillus soyae TaxID=2969249 RepID=A0A9X2MT57_9BACL|nr:FtsX-like permease family protein [Paenibacillus soyae]MCR2805817.1 ABC transporter permease [Paenibacillus soyae]
MNLWLIAWRNLKRRKLRTFLTIFSIVIGVASALAVMTSVDSAKRAFPLYLKAAFGKADFTINGTDAYFEQELLQDVQGVGGSTAIALLKENTKLHSEKKGLSAIQKRVDLTGFSRLDTDLTNFKVKEGKLTDGGAVITDRTAKAWNAKVGDTITFDTDEGSRTIRISAIVGYTVELMGPSSWTMAKYHPWSVAIPLPIMQEWFGLSGKIQNIQVKAEQSGDMAAIGRQLDELTRSHGDIYAQPVVVDYKTQFKELNTYFLLLYLAGFLGVALGAFIIFNTLIVSVQERKQEFAALKTIGYTPRQLRAFVLYEVCLLAVIGTLIGLVLGWGLAQLLQMVIFMVFGIHDQGTLDLAKGLLVAIPAGTIVPLIAALYPVRQAGKVSVVASLKSHDAASNGSKSPRKWPALAGGVLMLSAFFIKSLLLFVPFLLGAVLVFPFLFDLINRLIRPLYRSGLGFSGAMASRNLSRSRGRTTMTSVVLCLGIAMILLMSSLNSALIQSFEKVIHATYGGNLDVHLHHIEDTDLQQLREIKGVAGAETYPLHTAIWTLNGEKRQLSVYGAGEAWIDSFPLFTVQEGSPGDLLGKLRDDEVVLDQIAFGAWGGRVGDRVVLDTPEGVREFQVVAVVETMKNNGYGAFMRKSQFQKVFGIKYEKNALILKDESVTPLQLRERIFERFGSRIEEMFGPEDWVSVIGASYTGSFSIINFLVGLSILISGIGIANTLLMNIMERIRELGMMRAVGVTRRQVVRMIQLEGIGMGLTATISGCVLGTMLIYMTSSFMEIRSLTFAFGISWVILLVIFLFGLLVSLISSLGPAARAAKTPLSEALRYE